MTPDDAMRRIDVLLSHVWMVRAFLKHSEEAEEDERLHEIQRALYDYHLAVGPAWNQGDASAYLRIARKKLSRLRQARDEFARVAPEVSAHTNYTMAVASLAVAVAEIEAALAAVSTSAAEGDEDNSASAP